jgi:hypothetical protein
MIKIWVALVEVTSVWWWPMCHYRVEWQCFLSLFASKHPGRFSSLCNTISMLSITVLEFKRDHFWRWRRLSNRRKRQSYYKHVGDSRMKRYGKQMALTLCTEAKIPTDRPLGLSDIKPFEDLLVYFFIVTHFNLEKTSYVCLTCV